MFVADGRAEATADDVRDLLGRLNARFSVTRADYDPLAAVVTVNWAYPERPCLTPRHLAESKEILEGLAAVLPRSYDTESPVKWLVSRSDESGVYSLGGDLHHFLRCIRTRDRDALRDYGHACLDLTQAMHLGLGRNVRTVSLVQGRAFGGGFEAAQSAHVVVAEKGASFCFPEAMFGMFPGMGAFSYLSRRIGLGQAERLVLSSRTVSAEELHAMGAIDILAEDGDGDAEVRRYIAKNAKRHACHVAVRAVRRIAEADSEAETRDIVELWVDLAMHVERSDMRMMEKLVSAQNRMRTQAVAAE